ncbi:MAG: alkaline phosphatase family protein [Thermoplasmata archaeon]
MPPEPSGSSPNRLDVTAYVPEIFSHSNFSAVNTSPTSSPAFASNTGDTIVVFAQLFGTAQVSSVSDSSFDTFHRIVRSFQSFVTPYNSTIEQGLEVWVACNASGGTAVVLTLTISGPSRQSDAIAIVDVTGVPPVPVDRIGSPSNSTDVGQRTRSASSAVTTNSSDLVLSAVASRNYDLWTPVAPATRIDNVVTPTPGYYNTLTDFDLAPAVSGETWTNSTTNVTSPWIAESLALRAGSAYDPYPVGFSETGLPSGLNWSVTVNGSTHAGPTGTNLTYSLPNGTYPFTVNSVGPYFSTPSSGNVTVNGSAVAFAVAFSAPGYTVKFSEKGLPQNTPWTVSLDGASRTATSPSVISFSEVNGTHSFNVAPAAGYVPGPRAGNVTVNGSPVTVNLTFVKGIQVRFTEGGLPAGRTWSVTLGSLASAAPAGKAISFLVLKGTYAFSVGTEPGYAARPSSGNATVGNTNVNEKISFSKIIPTYAIEFVDHGLYRGVAWSVTLKTAKATSVAGSPIGFVEPNGSYAYTLGTPAGYSIASTGGSVNVKGANVTVPVDYTADVSHVVLIMLENQEVTHLWPNAPYERYLAAAYGNATDFYATCHSSTSQYLAVTSGNNFGCQSVSTDPGFNVTHLGDLFDSQGLSWMAYQESMPHPCDTTSNGTYLDYHEPFFFYQDVLDNRSRCASHIVNSEVFNESVQNGTLPNLSFYTPNYMDDGHGPTSAPWNQTIGLPYIEAFLRSFLPPILNHTGNYASPAEQTLVAHTVFVLMYDEGVTNLGYTTGGVFTPGCFNQTGTNETACGGHVQVTFVSPYSKQTQYTPFATSYNVESTIEWLFGLPSDGGWDGSSAFPAMRSLFTFGAANMSVGWAPSRAPSGSGSSGSGWTVGRAIGRPMILTSELLMAAILLGALGKRLTRCPRERRASTGDGRRPPTERDVAAPKLGR